MRTSWFLAACALASAFPLQPVQAQTPEEWIAVGTQVHGGFGTYIALGIRIGRDALEVLQAKPREVDVTLHSGPKAPCPCLADGVMVATSASPGQGTLRIAAEPAAEDQLGAVVIRHRRDGRTVRYTVPASAGALLQGRARPLRRGNGRVGAEPLHPRANSRALVGPRRAATRSSGVRSGGRGRLPWRSSTRRRNGCS
jgi:hypothetical protein